MFSLQEPKVNFYHVQLYEFIPPSFKMHLKLREIIISYLHLRLEEIIITWKKLTAGCKRLCHLKCAAEDANTANTVKQQRAAATIHARVPQPAKQRAQASRRKPPGHQQPSQSVTRREPGQGQHHNRAGGQSQESLTPGQEGMDFEAFVPNIDQGKLLTCQYARKVNIHSYTYIYVNLKFTWINVHLKFEKEK